MAAVDDSNPAAKPAPFAGIQGRSSADYFLRNALQEQVALNYQADFKASVIITASAVISSIAASQIDDDAIGIAAGVLVAFLLVALLLAVITVFPKYRIHKEPGEHLPDHWNPLYFGSYTRISKQRYLEAVDPILRSDGEIYRTMVADLYDKGVGLVTGKYRYLRVAYGAFITAFVAATITYFIAGVIVD